MDAFALKVADLDYERENLLLDLEKKHKQIERLIGHLNYFKDFKDKAILRLSIVKETISKLQKQNQDLTEENRSLGLRAACGFEGLTPRPEFRKLQMEGGIDPNIFYSPVNNKLLTTATIVQNMARPLATIELEPENRDLDISKRSLSKKSNTKRSKSSSKVKGGKQEKQLIKGGPSIVVSTYKSFEPSTQAPTKALDDITPHKNMFNSGERLDTMTSRKSNDPSIQNDSLLTPNSVRLDTSFSTQKYQVKIEPLKEEEENSTVDNNALEITNQLLGCVIEANKIFEHSFHEN